VPALRLSRKRQRRVIIVKGPIVIVTHRRSLAPLLTGTTFLFAAPPLTVSATAVFEPCALSVEHFAFWYRFANVVH